MESKKLSNEARKHSSPIIQKLMNNIDPITKLQIGTKMSISANIDDLMIAKGWTKKDIAKNLNKSNIKIERYLCGGHNFTIDELCEIAIIFKVSITNLIK